jgi:hypothetical protein
MIWKEDWLGNDGLKRHNFILTPSRIISLNALLWIDEMLLSLMSKKFTDFSPKKAFLLTDLI